MIIDIDYAQDFSEVAQQVNNINTSNNAKISDMTTHIFQIDPTVTLNNGDHRRKLLIKGYIYVNCIL